MAASNTVVSKRYSDIGRPTLDPFEKYTQRVTVPLTEAQYSALKDEARAQGFRSIADFVRKHKLKVA